jgi:hypothetical protein
MRFGLIAPVSFVPAVTAVGFVVSPEEVFGAGEAARI